MDTEADYVREMTEQNLGANEQEFLFWLKDNIGIEVYFKNDCYALDKVDLMIYLKGMYWKDYLTNLHYIARADSEKFKSVF